MDIIKAFQTNNSNDNITIIGTPEDPLFRASEIGEAIGMTNIRVIMKDFDDSEKVVRNAYTLGGPQEVTFLTEKGLYQVLFTSRKPIAKQFKNWVCDVIKEIRLKGKYELEKQLENTSKQVKETIKEKEQVILKNFRKKSIVYLGLASKDEGKFGYTDDIDQRSKDHKKEIREDWTPIYVYESYQNKEIERRIKQHPIIRKRRITKTYPGRTAPQTEIVKFDDEFTIADFDKLILQIKEEVESSENYATEIDKIRAENAELKLEIEKLKKLELDGHLKKIDLKTNSMYNLYDKISEIRKSMIYNFLVEFIAKAIVNNGTYKDFEIKIENDEIFNLYRTYVKKFRFTDIMYSEENEKGYITKMFNEVSGIKNGYVVKTSARVFHIARVSKWLCENFNISSDYVNIIKKMAQNYVDENYCEILNQDIKNDELRKSSYSFLIHLIIKYSNLYGNRYEGVIMIGEAIVKGEYTKFMLQFDSKVRKLTSMYEIFEEIGICRKNIRDGIVNGKEKRLKVLCIDLKDTLEWIFDNLEIPKEYENKLIECQNMLESKANE